MLTKFSTFFLSGFFGVFVGRWETKPCWIWQHNVALQRASVRPQQGSVGLRFSQLLAKEISFSANDFERI
jgi:hypothetical protein